MGGCPTNHTRALTCENTCQERMRKLKRDKENKERAARGELPLPDDDAPSAPPQNALAAAGGKTGGKARSRAYAYVHAHTYIYTHTHTHTHTHTGGEGASSSSSKAAGLGPVPGQVPLFKSGGGGGGDAARAGSVGAAQILKSPLDRDFYIVNILGQ
jgi:hypothetical protein